MKNSPGRVKFNKKNGQFPASVVRACLLILLLTSSFLLQAQDFGCFEIPKLSGASGDENALYQANTIDADLLGSGWWSFKIDHSKDGYYTDYYTRPHYSEQLKCEGQIVNGRQSGLWKFYFFRQWEWYSPDYVKMMYGNFLNGYKQGSWKVISFRKGEKDTFLLAELTFEKDTLNGPFTYYDDGKVIKKQNFLKGELSGPSVEFYRGKYLDDSIEVIEYYHNRLHGRKYAINKSGDTTSLEIFSNGKRDGLTLFKNEVEINYSQDLLDGWYTTYYGDGKIKQRVLFKNNLPYTTGECFGPDGKVLYAGTLNEGSGSLYEYYNDGRLSTMLQYENQLPHGEFLSLDVDSTVLERGSVFGMSAGGPWKEMNLPKKLCRMGINISVIWYVSLQPPTDYKIYGRYKNVLFEVFAAGDSVMTNEYFPGRAMTWKSIARNEGREQDISNYHEAGGKLAQQGLYKKIEQNGSWIWVKDGWFFYYDEKGVLKARVFYKNGEEAGRGYYYDNDGLLKRTKVIEESGRVYNLYNGDTVNVTDSSGRKQGKWLRLSGSGKECNPDVNGISFYKDNHPVGKWLLWGNDTLEWIDSVLAYRRSYETWGFAGLHAEGYILDEEFKTGVWKYYHYDKGYLQSTGEYLFNNKVGKWTTYNRRGKIKKVTDYSNKKDRKRSVPHWR